MKYFVITPIWDYNGIGGDLKEFDEIADAEEFINEHLPYINKNTGFSNTVFTGADFTVIKGKEVKVNDVQTVTKVKLDEYA